MSGVLLSAGTVLGMFTNIMSLLRWGYYDLPRFAVEGATPNGQVGQWTQQPLSSSPHPPRFPTPVLTDGSGQWNRSDFWFVFPLSPLHPHSPPSLFSPSCCACFTDLPVKWSSDTEHSNWAEGYDGSVCFFLCQLFSCREQQENMRDINVVTHSKKLHSGSCL